MVETSEWAERLRAAHAALEQWRSLPKGQHRRKPLEELAAAYPDVITVEWLPDNRVKITECIG
jgi:hypothetical protein